MIPCRLKGEKMKKYQITYCLDGEVLFKTKNNSGYQLVANFLSANSDSWTIEDELIIFNTEQLSNQYLELVNKIQ